MDSGKSHQIVREIDFVIQIRDMDSGFTELRELLIAELTRFQDIRRKNVVNTNPLFDFFRTNIEKSVALHNKTQVFISRYREKEGSFTIEFSVVIITPYIYYGSIRQALEILIKDTITDYFEELLERHLPVNITTRSTDKEVAYNDSTNENKSVQPEQIKQVDKKSVGELPLVLSVIALTISILLLISSVVYTLKLESSKDEIEWKDKYFELLLEKKLNDGLKTIHFNHPTPQVADTLVVPPANSSHQ